MESAELREGYDSELRTRRALPDSQQPAFRDRLSTDRQVGPKNGAPFPVRLCPVADRLNRGFGQEPASSHVMLGCIVVDLSDKICR